MEYQRTGGFAGLEEELIIFEDGAASLTRHGQTTDFSLDQATLADLEGLFKDADFTALDREYRSQLSGADLITYRIYFQDHQVTTEDGAIPESLGPVVEALNRVIENGR
ncbi:MAG: hypothetical protein L0Z70_08420 [Chloroflexi bacterium]|nr:hypothetical protein [Chloroflexota bacterium]